jgi:iron complex outermembrane recepter protein
MLIVLFLLLLLPGVSFGQGATGCSFKIESRDGGALGGVAVEMRSTAGPGVKALTKPDGSVVFEGLAKGDYSLDVLGRGYLPLQRQVQVPEGCGGPAMQLETIQTTIEVKAPSSDFLATESVSVTKSPMRLLDVPYPVQVLPRALLEDRNIQDIKDLYRNISGITDSPYSAMTMRGFTQREVLFNGVRGNPFGSLDNDINDAGFSTSQGRLTNVEFVEVLKGPAAVLFGGGEAGGVVNFVTRKPRNVPSAEASFRTGSFSQRGGHGEVTGPLGKSKNLFYRAAIYGEDRRLFRYNSGSENLHVATGLSWKAAEATSVGFEYEYMDQNLLAHRLRGIPVNAAGGWLAAREWTASEPTDRSELQARVFQTRVDHAFTSTLRSDVTLRYLNYDRPEKYHEPRGINADGRTMRREYRDQFRGNEDVSVTANGYAKVSRNQLTFGFEAVRQDWLGRYGTVRDMGRGGPVLGLDLLAPVYGRSVAYPIAATAFTRQNILASRQAVFIQDQIVVTPRLQIVLGGRLERFTDEGSDGAQALRAKLAAFTGRVAGVYRVRSNVSLFGSYSNSFNRAPSLAQTAAANGPHDPERGRQFEAGLKSELRQGRVLVNAAYFSISKTDVLRLDPLFGPRGDNFAAVFPIGEVRNRGLELDVTGKVTADLSVVLNYAYLDSKILADRFSPAAVGLALPNAARHAGGLFARYDYRKTGTSLHVGSEMRGRRFEPYAGFAAGGYAVWDFGVFQKIGSKLELRGQLDNAGDKLYAASSLFAARAGNVPGNPRTFTLGLHFRSPRKQ